MEKSEKTAMRDSGLRGIGEQIKQRRQSKGWSLSRFAEKAGVTKNTIMRVEAGESWQSTTITKICNALDANLQEFMHPLKLREGEDYLCTRGSLALPIPRTGFKLATARFGKLYELPRLEEGVLNRILLEIEPKKETQWREHDGEEHVYALTPVGVRLGGEDSKTDILLEEGETLAFWSTESHQYYNPLEQTARVLVIWVEKGFDFDEYLVRDSF